MLAKTTEPLQENGFQEVFPAMVRAGINARFILDRLEAIVSSQMPPNGYLEQGGGGIETAGATVAVNDMLLHSWEGFLRLFPVWPLHEEAAFASLRAVGAFLVSAQLANGKVSSGVSITSEAGHSCTVIRPPGWPAGCVGNSHTMHSGGGRNDANRPTHTTGITVINQKTGAAVPVSAVTIGRTTDLWQFATELGATYLLSPSQGC